MIWWTSYLFTKRYKYVPAYLWFSIKNFQNQFKTNKKNWYVVSEFRISCWVDVFEQDIVHRFKIRDWWNYLVNSSHYWYVCKFLKFAKSVVTCSVYCEKTTFITLVSTVFLLHGVKIFLRLQFKGEKILKGSQDSISSPSRSHKYLNLNFLFLFFWQNIAGQCQQFFCPKCCTANFPAHNLNFHWRWRWWDQI